MNTEVLDGTVEQFERNLDSDTMAQLRKLAKSWGVQVPRTRAGAMTVLCAEYRKRIVALDAMMKVHA